MPKSKIVVKRWRIYARKVWESFKRPFTRLLWRIRSLAHGNSSSARVNIKTPTLAKNRPSTATPGVLRIARRDTPGDLGKTIPAVGTEDRLSGRRRKRRSQSGISVTTEGLALCKACGDPIGSEDVLARCRRDESHSIHKRCVHLMMNKCPHCGGPIE